MKYYHGGAPELSVGDRIVPRKDHPEWREYPVGYANETMPEFGEYKAVALTTDVEIARAYASQYVRPDAHRVPGQVYEVRPLGTVAVDPNFVHSFPEMVACQEGAEIVAVHDVVDIETNPRASVKALAKHLVNIWTGQPLYDEHGFIRLTEGLEAEGFTREDLRRLGPWAPYQYASKFTRFLEPIPPLL